MLVFELNNRFAFHGTDAWKLNCRYKINSQVFTHDFLTCGNKIRLSVYIILIVWVTDVCLPGRMVSALCFSLAPAVENRWAGSILLKPWSLLTLMSSSKIPFYAQ